MGQRIIHALTIAMHKLNPWLLQKGQKEIKYMIIYKKIDKKI